MDEEKRALRQTWADAHQGAKAAQQEARAALQALRRRASDVCEGALVGDVDAVIQLLDAAEAKKQEADACAKEFSGGRVF